MTLVNAKVTQDCCDVYDPSARESKEALRARLLEVAGLSELFKVLGDETRTRILYLLSLKELCVCDIAEIMEMSLPAVSHHLRLLKALRIVKYRRGGQAGVLLPRRRAHGGADPPGPGALRGGKIGGTHDPWPHQAVRSPRAGLRGLRGQDRGSGCPRDRVAGGGGQLRHRLHLPASGAGAGGAGDPRPHRARRQADRSGACFRGGRRRAVARGPCRSGRRRGERCPPRGGGACPGRSRTAPARPR